MGQRKERISEKIRKGAVIAGFRAEVYEEDDEYLTYIVSRLNKNSRGRCILCGGDALISSVEGYKNGWILQYERCEKCGREQGVFMRHYYNMPKRAQRYGASVYYKLTGKDKCPEEFVPSALQKKKLVARFESVG